MLPEYIIEFLQNKESVEISLFDVERNMADMFKNISPLRGFDMTVCVFHQSVISNPRRSRGEKSF